MVDDTVESMIPIGDAPNIYYGMAFDGRCFYLSTKCGIVKFNPCTKEFETIELFRTYQHLCCDLKNGGYWATSLSCPTTVYRLDREFREIDYIVVPSRCIPVGDQIAGLSWDNCHEGLLVAFQSRICRIPNCNPSEAVCFELNVEGTVTGVLSLFPSDALTKQNGACQKIMLMNSGIQDCILVAKQWFIASMVLDPCHPPRDGELTVYLLVVKQGCYPYLAKMRVCMGACDVAPCNFCPPHPCCDDCSIDCQGLLEDASRTEREIAQALQLVSKLMQRGIAQATCVEELICLNQSVTEIIAHVTELEICSTNRLREIVKCCCPCACDPLCQSEKKLCC